MVSPIPPRDRPDTMGAMRRLVLVLAVGAGLALAPAALASPTVRLTIIHFVRGCHVWGTVDGRPLGPSQTLTVRHGTALAIRINCPMSFVFSQQSGPKLALPDPRSFPGTVWTIVFAKPGLYRLRAVNVESSEQLGLQTLGADNTLQLTVRAR